MNSRFSGEQRVRLVVRESSRRARSSRAPPRSAGARAPAAASFRPCRSPRRSRPSAAGSRTRPRTTSAGRRMQARRRTRGRAPAGQVPGLSRPMARSRTSSRPESPPTGSAPCADDLHPRVVLRVVRGGDHHAAVEPELADGEIDHLGADEADVEHLRARRRSRPRSRAFAIDGDESRMSRPTAIRFGLELLHVGTADRAGALLVQLPG